VLSASLAPARVDAAMQAVALSHARKLAEALDYVGVFALELFCRDGELLANELAPRVHNSGHWTIEGSETSQFQNHLRAVLGLPLGDTRMLGVACMLNWIGEMPDAVAVLGEAGGSLARLRQAAARGPQGRACHAACGHCRRTRRSAAARWRGAGSRQRRSRR
jgi:5-(carboxyamino)imidazole ribonucleotide synthase